MGFKLTKQALTQKMSISSIPENRNPVQNSQPDTMEQKENGSAPTASIISPTVREEEEQIFRLQVQVDMQRERELLYKVVLVIEIIFALILLREFSLWLLK